MTKLRSEWCRKWHALPFRLTKFLCILRAATPHYSCGHRRQRRREPPLVPRCHYHCRRRWQQPHQLAEARLENQTAKKKKKPEHRVEKLHPRMCVCARLHQSATHCCRRSLRCVPPPRLLLLGVRGHLIDFSPQNWSCYFNRPLLQWCRDVCCFAGLIWVLNCRMIIMITVSSSPACT